MFKDEFVKKLTTAAASDSTHTVQVEEGMNEMNVISLVYVCTRCYYVTFSSSFENLESKRKA